MSSGESYDEPLAAVAAALVSAALVSAALALVLALVAYCHFYW